MKRFIPLFCLLCVLFVACSNQPPANNTPHSSQVTGNIVAVGNSPVAISGGPTDPPAVTPTSQPTVAPTAKPTTKPKPTATPTPAPSGHSCSIASCPNPWNFHLQNGAGSPLVTVAPAGFCNWFVCMPDFGNEGGDIIECSNGEFSWNGAESSEGCSGMTIMGWLAP